SGNNLQSILEVVRPANSGAEEKRVRPLGMIRSHHLLGAGEDSFQHEVKASVHKPDEALAKIVDRSSRVVTRTVLSLREECGSSIPVSNEFLVNNHTHWKTRLQAETTGAAAQGGISSGKYQAKAGSESNAGVAISCQLIAIIQQDVAD